MNWQKKMNWQNIERCTDEHAIAELRPVRHQSGVTHSGYISPPQKDLAIKL